MRRSLEGWKRDLAMLLAGALVAGLLIAPVGAHVGESISHLWNRHIKSRVTGLVFTKARSDLRYARKTAEPWRDVGGPGQPAFNPTGCQNTTTNAFSPAISSPGYAPVGFFKDLNGMVHLRGTLQCQLNTGYEFDSATFILPPAYRPNYNTYVASVNCSREVMWIQISAAGEVQPEDNAANYACAILDGVSFGRGS